MDEIPKPPLTLPNPTVSGIHYYDGPEIEDFSQGVHRDYLSLVKGDPLKEFWFMKMCRLTDNSDERDTLRRKTELLIKRELMKQEQPIDLDALGLMIVWETDDIIKRVVGRELSIPTIYYDRAQGEALHMRDIHRASGLAHDIMTAWGEIAHQPIHTALIPSVSNNGFTDEQRREIKQHEYVHAIHPGIYSVYHNRHGGMIVAEMAAEIGAECHRPSKMSSGFDFLYFLNKEIPKDIVRPSLADAETWLRTFIQKMVDNHNNVPDLVRTVMKCCTIGDLILVFNTIFPLESAAYLKFPAVYPAEAYKQTKGLEKDLKIAKDFLTSK